MNLDVLYMQCGGWGRGGSDCKCLREDAFSVSGLSLEAKFLCIRFEFFVTSKPFKSVKYNGGLRSKHVYEKKVMFKLELEA